jgi:phosphate ABC transporter substrate-binding protein, PhoT family (TC 3.A.1.7.1)
MASNQTGHDRRITRRTALASAAGLGTVAIAGCTNDSGSSGDDGSESNDGGGGASFEPQLTVAEIEEIWAADGAEMWSDVREEFPDEEIVRYGAADTSGTFDYFIENIGELGERGHTDDYEATEQDNTIAQGVQGDPYAIGYFGFSYYYNNPDELTPIAIADGDDNYVEPSLDTAASGEYTPLTRNLFTYPSTESLQQEHIARFARYFVDQTTNEDLVAGDVGYVPATDEQQEAQRSALNEEIGDAGTGDGEISGDITIAGSSTVFPLMTAVAEDFSADHPNINIDVSSTGSGGGFSNFFCVGESDFNNASRPIKEEEQNLCSENGVDYLELVAAKDALTVVVDNSWLSE